MAIIKLPTYDMNEVRKHDSEGDAWIVIEGYVHDVSEFLQEHPGGKDIIMDHLGKDASEVFTSEKVHVHGNIAFKMLAKYPCFRGGWSCSLIYDVNNQENATNTYNAFVYFVVFCIVC
jgi:4-hydroxysphinganine ceramide fatty acyl 2-hydroxylase